MCANELEAAAALCAACGSSSRPEAVLCARCAERLDLADPVLGNGPAGLDRAWSSALYEGVAREVDAALRFRHLLPVADLIAERIAWLAPSYMLSGTIVPVPAPKSRLRPRRFEPAAALASALAERIDAPVSACLEQRPHSSAARERPIVCATEAAPRSAVLIDDVLKTGAQLTACARALRGAGAARVVAITFARQL